MIELYNDDSLNIFYKLVNKYHDRNIIIVTDPPFNIGYHYEGYSDKLDEDEYYEMLDFFLRDLPSVVVQYPENLYKVAFQIGKFPTRVVSWVYNSNTRKQHRDIAFFDIIPNFSQVKQPYKNPNDKRIKERLAKGKGGANLYDWWNINQVKNVSKEKTAHPCQMPLEVMRNIIGILPKDCLVIDPFMGSGTTGVACKEIGVDFVGIELVPEYYEIAKERINQCTQKQ